MTVNSTSLYRFIRTVLEFPAEAGDEGNPDRSDTVKTASGASPASDSMRRLEDLGNQYRRQLESVRQSVNQVGVPPPGYPWHIRAVMNGISALLPWYTRPIRQFCENATATLECTKDFMNEVEKVLRKQQSELEYLKVRREV